MQNSEPQQKTILPNVQVYGNDCWLQCVVLLCYYNNNNYNRIINYKGNIPFLIHLRNFFNEIKNLEFLFYNKFVDINGFYKQLATSMLSTTEQLKDDAVDATAIALVDKNDYYRKDRFYGACEMITALNELYHIETGDYLNDIVKEYKMFNLQSAETTDKSLKMDVYTEINNNVIFFHNFDHWTTAIRDQNGKFLYYDNTRPYK